MRRFPLLLLALSLFLTGCESDSDGNGAAEPAPVDLTPTPLVLDDVAPGELIAVEPGGETICSRGTPFRFFVRGGSVNRVVVDFAGGGACWNELTCSVAGAIFNEEAPTLADIKLGEDFPGFGGLYDLENEENPFKDHTIVHIPYCTVDIHWGDATVSYTDDVVIHHRGYQNVMSALDWVYERFEDPEEVFVTGCSAGAYGSIVHSAHLAHQYPDTRMRVLADSGAGIITDTFLADSFPKWNAQSRLPEWIDGLQGDVTQLNIEDVYQAIATEYPDQRFAQFTTAFDDDQVFYYDVMGGEPDDWSPRMFTALENIEAKTSNFRSYIAPGPMHCIIPYTHMYTRTSDDVRFVDWLTSFLRDPSIPDSVACSGDDCLSDSVCDACAEGNGHIYCGFCDGWESPSE